MSNNVHHQRKVPSYLLIYIMWSRSFQCPRSQVSWDHPYRWVVLVLSSHVCSIHNRLNSTLGFFRRNLRRCPAKLKEIAYITLVRSTLEYAAPVWDHHLARDCDLLEKIQRRSIDYIFRPDGWKIVLGKYNCLSHNVYTLQSPRTIFHPQKE